MTVYKNETGAKRKKKKQCIRNTLHMAIINPSLGLVFQTQNCCSMYNYAVVSLWVLSQRLTF